MSGTERSVGGTWPGRVFLALAVGVGTGLIAAGFRWLVLSITWLVTGSQQWGQQGHAASTRVAWLGIWFVVLAPVIGGLIYGPLIERFAREARGPGVPEVIRAAHANGGRIRPQAAIVKALATAICIGTGGSLGREGPIIQIGSGFASWLGQLARLPEDRLPIIVACGTAGGIAGTFNAPLSGVFFGCEIILRDFSLETLFPTILSAVAGDLVSRASLGSAPFFAALPHNLSITNDSTYLLIALLGLGTGLLGAGFKTFMIDLGRGADRLWGGRPEWLRPAAGGVLLGLLLLAIPQMYGTGYPVINRAIAGQVALGLVVLFVAAKILATSLTLAIGGSGGLYGPSVFIGAMAGTAYGIVLHHMFAGSVGPVALYSVVAMAGVFASVAQAPLTAITSITEMTGDSRITVAILLAAGLAAMVSRRLRTDTLYTAMLLLGDNERATAPGFAPALGRPEPARRGSAVHGRGRRNAPPGTADAFPVVVSDHEDP